MKERPLLMKPDMALAAHREIKTQTRRAVTPQPIIPDRFKTRVHPGAGCIELIGKKEIAGRVEYQIIDTTCPYGLQGDWLWIKEQHYLFGEWEKDGLTKTGRTKWRFRYVDNAIHYAEDPPASICSEKTQYGWFKRNSLFMPRWASRTAVPITAIRIERLQDITAEDALAEGIKDVWTHRVGGSPYPINYIEDIKHAFKELWDSINRDRAPWKDNPWVWVIDF